MDKIPQSSTPPKSELSATRSKYLPHKWVRVWGRFVGVMVKIMVNRCIANFPRNREKDTGENTTPIKSRLKIENGHSSASMPEPVGDAQQKQTMDYFDKSSIEHLTLLDVDHNGFNAMIKANNYEKSGDIIKAEWLRAKIRENIIDPTDKKERPFRELDEGAEGRTDLVFRGVAGPLEVKKTLHNCGGDTKAEIALLKRLDHPNIVKILPNENTDIAEEGSLMMKNGGDSLFQFLLLPDNQKPEHSRSRFVSIARQLADVLDYLSKEQVLHRDIKPGNIVIDQAGNISLIDFGMAYDRQTNTCCNPTGRGTEAYLEPDAMGEFTEAKFSDTADMFAAGHTLYNLLTSKHVTFPDFYEKQRLPNGNKYATWDAYKKNLNATKVLVSTIAETLEGQPRTYIDQVTDMLTRMLEPNPKLRITPEELKNHPLLRVRQQ